MGREGKEKGSLEVNGGGVQKVDSGKDRECMDDMKEAGGELANSGTHRWGDSLVGPVAKGVPNVC